MTGCDNSEDGGINVADSSSGSTSNKILLSDYSIPDSFAMTIQVADVSIFNKGSSWYFKTARLNNDWQLIEYDRDAADRTQQTTHFFKYLTEDSYTHYTYDFEKNDWTKLETVDFTGMVQVSAINFDFLYSLPYNYSILDIEETDVSYDTDPTSIVNKIDAIRYVYSDVLDYDIIVDAQYKSVKLTENVRDGSTMCIENKASEYKLPITEWNNTYMSRLNYKDAPGSSTKV